MKPMIIKVCKLLIFADGYGNNIILKILLCQAPLTFPCDYSQGVRRRKR